MSQIYFHCEFPKKGTIPLIDLAKDDHKLYFEDPGLKMQLRNINKKVVFDFQDKYNIIYLNLKLEDETISELLPYRDYEHDDNIKLPSGLSIFKTGKINLNIEIHPILLQHLRYYHLPNLNVQKTIHIIKKPQTNLAEFKLKTSKITFASNLKIPVSKIFLNYDKYSDTKPIYTVSDPQIATIENANDQPYLSILSVGEVDILCIYKGNKYYKPYYQDQELEVVKGVPNITVKDFGKIIYNRQDIILKNYIRTNSNRTNFQYISLNTDIAEIQFGILKIKSSGTLDIKVTLPRNNNYKKKTIITSLKIDLEEVNLEWQSLNSLIEPSMRKYGNSDIELTSKLAPSIFKTQTDSTNPTPNFKNLHYYSENKNIARIVYSYGRPYIHFQNCGTTTIRAEYRDTYYALKTITSQITITPKQAKMKLIKIHEKLQLPLHNTRMKSYSYKYNLPMTNMDVPVNFEWKLLDPKNQDIPRKIAYLTIKKDHFRITYQNIEKITLQVNFLGNRNWLPCSAQQNIEILNINSY